MVQGFREVRRVLKSDGTLWLNLGDSYATGAGKVGNCPGGGEQGERWKKHHMPQTPDKKNGNASIPTFQPNRMPIPGLKPKDLVGIPWMVARALRDPFYSGRIKQLEDRVWLAAMLDAEGCMFIQKRKAGQNNGQGYQRQNDNFGSGLEISNTHEAIIRRCMEIAGIGSICTQSEGRRQMLFRWNVRTIECRELIRELYPHLVAKQQQARIAYGCPSSGPKAEAAHAALMMLHRGQDTTVDFPPPSSCFESGYYLRQDIIWSKLNPMPESVTDRCTKAHEYLFLLTKSARYFYDATAIAEPASQAMLDQVRNGYDGTGTKDFFGAGVQNASDVKSRIIEGARKKARKPAGWATHEGSHGSIHRDGREQEVTYGEIELTSNKRSVWTIPTQPYAEAHFATFPPGLIKPCILAGSKPGDTILDPFGGSGTTGQVALELGRKALLIELNQSYIELIKQRCDVTPGLALA